MLWIWIGFILFVVAMLALDLGVFHRKAHVVSVREALGWSAVWVTLGLAFSGVVYLLYENQWLGVGLPGGSDTTAGIVDQMAVSESNPQGINDGSSATIKYLTGYLIEKSLSIDNIFVIAMLFGFFAVPAKHQHRVLFWGIFGALVMRGIMIGAGAKLIEEFHWMIYLFGGFLVLTGVKMLLMKTDHADPGRNIVVRLVKRLLPATHEFHGQHFFVRAGADGVPQPKTVMPGALMITPLFVALIMVEVTDLIFAVDSIPAIFAITTDPFLVFTSIVFAILGLRSLYFALAGMIDKFRYLKVSLALVLMLVGVKMMAHAWLKELLGEHFNFYLLGAVLLILATGVGASMLVKRDAPVAAPSHV